MFYAISKRRRDINAAEARGREIGRAEKWVENYAKGWEEGYAEGREEILSEALAVFEARLKDNPDAIAVIAELRAQFPNDRHR